MTNPSPATIPEGYGPAVSARLERGESVFACLEVDLDEELRFSPKLVVLTDRRLLTVPPHSEPSTVTNTPSKSTVPATDGQWRLADFTALEVTHQGSLGKLELLGADGLVACWRFTAGRVGQARRLVSRWASLGRDEPEEPSGSICPSCGAPMPLDFDQCPACKPKPVTRLHASLVRLLPFAMPRIGMVLLGFVLTVAGTGAAMIPPYLTMPLVDKVLIPYQNGQEVPSRLLYVYMSGLGVAALIAWLLSWARSYVLAWVSERISADLRNRTYEHLQRLSLEFFGGKRTGDLMSRLSSDTDRICNFLSLNLLDFGSDVLMMVMTALVLMRINWQLALVTLLPFPLIAWMVHGVRERLRHGFHVGGRAWGEMTSVLADTIPGIRVVKAFAQEKREVDRFRKSNDHILHANDRINKVWAFFGSTVTLLTEGGLLIVWACGAYQVMHGKITVGVLTAFVTYIGRFYTKLESLSWMAGATQRAASATQRIFEILDRVPSVAEPARPVTVGRLRGEIEFRDVCFQYGSRRVLHHIDLKVSPGEMVGLVGASGAGKSTLVNLVCRFYDVAEGVVTVDGHDIRSFPVEAYRHNIGIVLQEPFLFYGTIAENIAYGRPDATRREIIAAAQAAKAHEFILRLPEGYDSQVGERGQSLSGGERQRISIARALLINPAILILDEATSSVDTETEREIQEALDNLVRGRTTIAIAHRLSTLRRAHRIVVLERGRIVEMGSHEELLKNERAYARLHRAQYEQAAAGDGGHLEHQTVDE